MQGIDPIMTWGEIIHFEILTDHQITAEREVVKVPQNTELNKNIIKESD